MVHLARHGLDAPQEGAWGVVLTDRHFEMAREAGLDHVRLPVRFSAHAAATAPFTIDEAFFQRVDWAIERASSNGLQVIVDRHHLRGALRGAGEVRAALPRPVAADRRALQGATGAIDRVDEQSRENYLRLVRLEAERRGIAWALWDDGGRNQAMDVRSGTWTPAVQRALFASVDATEDL